MDRFIQRQSLYPSAAAEQQSARQRRSHHNILQYFLTSSSSSSSSPPAMAAPHARSSESRSSESRAGDVQEIFADGSCIGNGKRSAVGGVGVYFGPGDVRNYSRRYTSSDVATMPSLDGVTNQTMELMAIVHALSRVGPLQNPRRVIVNTDSMYAIKCVTVWSVQWKRNGWRTASGKAVQNRRMIEDVLRLVEQTSAVLVHVRGHGIEPRDRASRAWHMWHGNMQADALATSAARGEKFSMT